MPYLAYQCRVHGTVSHYQDVLSITDSGIHDLLKKALCPSYQIVKTLRPVLRNIFLRFEEQCPYRAFRLIENIFDAFIDAEPHLRKPVVYYHGNVPSIKDQCRRLAGPHER